MSDNEHAIDRLAQLIAEAVTLARSVRGNSMSEPSVQAQVVRCGLRDLHETLQLPEKLVTKKELRSVYGIPYAPQHIAKLEKAGKFPKRIQLSENRVAWSGREIEQWICARPRGGQQK